MKVLVIGLGSIAKKHIKAIREIEPSSVIYALRRSKFAAQEEGIVNIYDLNELPNIDFIIISNPTAEHAKTLELLYTLRIPMFIEKPLFDNLDNKTRLLREITELNVPTYIACNLRFLECLCFTKNFLKKKRVNEVNVYCGSYLPNWRPNVDFKKVYSANKEMGGGVHIDLIHEIDYTVWLFGFPKHIRKEFTNKSSLAISAVDYANYLLEYDDFSANIILNYYRRSPKRFLEVICDDGECYVDLLKNNVTWNGDVIFESEQSIIDTYSSQMQYFLKQVIQGIEGNRENDIVEAFKILKLCLED